MSIDSHNLDDLLGRLERLIKTVEAGVAVGEIDASTAAEFRDEVADLVEGIAAIVDGAEELEGNRDGGGRGEASPARYLALAKEASGAGEPGVDTSPPWPVAAANQATGAVSYRELAEELTGIGEAGVSHDTGSEGEMGAGRYRVSSAAPPDELAAYRALINELDMGTHTHE